ncbi:hypothetical protein IB241_11745 [Pseudomonas sp. PDM05]|jgi:hypothetical protein|uniref:hypothetical protein n=1 Tax=unclassified Pseudomonas TaxID=196821 RepID=UPI00177C467E|nr:MULTISPECIES: hypothetical protein [unclassified Pseudomonas]MBD9458359.1 hypothetical protein [Pseudomonas sp. PDM05]WLH79550.1 hypothetical protein PSH81_00840 [Pseudomonas sp. FP2335]
MRRYEGKPFLRLLECYVLAAIGELSDEQQATLRAMEPKLHEVYGTSGSWQSVIEVQMDFPATVADKIRAIWQANVEKFANAGTAINAEDFAQHFVDTNFP